MKNPTRLETDVFGSGLHLPECPRWHDGALWISDMWGNAVYSYGDDGERSEVLGFGLEEDPGGLGWLPDGSLLVVGMEGRRIYRLAEDGDLRTHADLGPHAPWQCNDMIVDDRGTAYVSQFGYDLWGGRTGPATTALLRVTSGGTVDVAAEDLMVPNGMAISDDGSALYVAECGRSRVLQFGIDDQGALTNRRVFGELVPAAGAPLPVAPPDGICLDEEGCVWAADPIGRARGENRARRSGEPRDPIRRASARRRARGDRSPHAVRVRKCSAPQAPPRPPAARTNRRRAGRRARRRSAVTSSDRRATALRGCLRRGLPAPRGRR